MRGARGKRLALAASVVLLVALSAAAGCAGPFLVVAVPARHPDVIVSLASHEWERLPAVVAAARKYPSATILLTVPSPVTEHNCHRCSERPLWLAQAGIDPHRIQVLSDPVASTHDEALAVLRYAASAGPGEIHVVTSPYHARRALATFRSVFGKTRIAVTLQPALRSSQAHPSGWWRRGYDRAYVAYEWAAIVYYAARYRIYPWSG